MVGEEGDDDELPISEKKKRNIQQPECNYDDFVLLQDLIVWPENMPTSCQF